MNFLSSTWSIAHTLALFIPILSYLLFLLYSELINSPTCTLFIYRIVFTFGYDKRCVKVCSQHSMCNLLPKSMGKKWPETKDNPEECEEAKKTTKGTK